MAIRLDRSTQIFEKIGSLNLCLNNFPVEDVWDMVRACPGSNFGTRYAYSVIVLR